MREWTLAAAMVIAGCGGVSDGTEQRTAALGAAATARPADDAGLPLLGFGADWSVTQSGPIVSGGQARLHYDVGRLPACRAWYRGFPAWDIVAYWSVDGGPTKSAVVTQLQGSQRVPVDVTLDVPPGRDLALWFHASDEFGCDQWDSDFGRNFHVALAPGLPTAHFRWPSWSDDVDGTPAAGADFLVDYDLRRLPGCRQGYNGLATWDVTVDYRFDDGLVGAASLTRTSDGYTRVAAPAQLHAPADARSVELWFEAEDRTGCQAWDSAYGTNYTLALQ
jgi:hypothetical protein